MEAAFHTKVCAVFVCVSVRVMIYPSLLLQAEQDQEPQSCLLHFFPANAVACLFARLQIP